MTKFVYLHLNVQVIPPGSPVIYSPDVLVRGDTIVLTCSSIGGSPTPTVKWFRDNAEITTGIRTSTSGSTVTTTFTFVTTLNEHYEVFECQADNGVLQNPLKITKFVYVHYTPDAPIVNGPTRLVADTAGTWTCTSANGYPAGTMSMKNTNTSTAFGPPAYSVTSTPINGGRSFTVVGTLNWSPALSNNNHQLCCEVAHPTTIITPQSDCLTLSLKATEAEVRIPVTFYEEAVGNSIILGCQVSSNNPLQSVQWIFTNRNGQVTDPIVMTSPKYSGSTTTSPSLTINNVQFSDGGTYRCRASNLIGLTVGEETTFLDIDENKQEQSSTGYIAVVSVLSAALVISGILNVTLCLKRRAPEKSSNKGQKGNGRPGIYDTSSGENNPHFYDVTDTYENISNIDINKTRSSPTDNQTPMELYHKYTEVR